jgi:DNA-binding response OmpR family regulator
VQEERGHERILLVEDDEAIRRLSARVLRRAGYDVTEANDGDDAAAYLARCGENGAEPFALIVSDIVMPRGGGARVLEAARILAADSRLIWVTGYAGSSYDHTEVHAPCAAPIIQKPWTTRELLARVRLVLDAPPNIPPATTTDELPRGT